LSVRTDRPVLACLGSQYAGWHLAGEGGAPLMGSGPARALARLEPIFDGIAHQEQAERAILVLEGDQPPGDEAADKVAGTCGLRRDQITLLHAPTGSLAGTVQIAARVIECALQKARALHLDLVPIREATGTAPIAQPDEDTRKAMGRSNDAIIYGGRVHLVVSGPDDLARSLAEALPSRTAPDWGRSFAEVYAEAEGDFARIDPGLFSPAEVTVTAQDSGRTFASGRPDPDRLSRFLRTD
jgi:methenyltetrahydromethanopterin cyclohydrolase